MNIIRKITIKTLALNKKRTAISLIGIVLAVALITGVIGLAYSFQDFLNKEAIISAGPWAIEITNPPQNNIDEIKGEDFVKKVTIDNTDGERLKIEVKDLDKSIYNKGKYLEKKYNLQEDNVIYNSELLRAQGITSHPKFDQSLLNIEIIILLLIGVTAILVISNGILISASERKGQFAIIKSIGGTDWQIKKSIIWEGIILALIGIPIGIFIGILLEYGTLVIVNNLMSGIAVGAEVTKMTLVLNGINIGGAILVSLVTIGISTILPSLRFKKISAVEAIRKNDEIKLRKKKYRSSILMSKLFGFSGALASKNMKRSKSKFRTTIVSLSISIILFLSIATFLQIVDMEKSLQFKNVSYDYSVTLLGATPTQFEEINKKLENFSNSKHFVDTLPAETDIEIDNMDNGVRLFSVDKKREDEILKKINVDSNTFNNKDKITGIFVKEYPKEAILNGQHKLNSRHHEEDVEDNGNTINENINIVSSVDPKLLKDEDPNSGQPGGMSSVIVSKSNMEKFSPGGKYQYNIYIKSDKKVGFTKAANKIFSEGDIKIAHDIYDVRGNQSSLDNVFLLASFFAYGFLIMIFLITATSVIGAISANMNLRKREFAVLKSTGMTEKELKKMLMIESLIYGIKSLLWGVPIGVLLSYLIYTQLIVFAKYPYIFPWKNILIAALIIGALVWITVRYSQRKLAKENIIDTIRGDNI